MTTLIPDKSAIKHAPTRKTVAIAGNPNAGKTTIFNALTGLRYKVANYPGVTVERRDGTCKLNEELTATIIDLPGCYDLVGDSPDERIATAVLNGKLAHQQKPDLIVCVVDASNLERNLFLTSQLIDLSIPIVIALNMMDIAKRRGIIIRTELLSRQLDLPVVPLTASNRLGLDELKREISKMCAAPISSSKQFAWNTDPSLELKGSEPELRYRWIKGIVTNSTTVDPAIRNPRSERLDKILTHQIWGSLIFVGLMAILFQSIFSWTSLPTELIDQSISSFGSWLGTQLPEGELKSLLVDGIVAGVGSVLVFIPQIALLYFLISLLEDSGYLSRAAYLVDNFMRRFGLHGRSFIPLLSSFACAVPGIMATRTIPSWRDRLATILVAPLMSCSARLPVYALLIAAFIPATQVAGIFSLQGLVLLGLYLSGIIAAALIGLILSKTILRGSSSHLVMEMPAYKIPSLSGALRNSLDRIYLFIVSAGSVILACSILLWYLATHPQSSELSAAQQIQHSYAGKIGMAIEPIIKPLGYDWKIGIALLASFAAREVFVSSLATVYNIESSDEATNLSLIETLRHTPSANGEPAYSLATALSLMVFFAFACQCMSTLAVCRRETASWRWPLFMFGYMTILAYASAYGTYQLALRFL